MPLLSRRSVLPVFKDDHDGNTYDFMDTYVDALMDMQWKYNAIPLQKDVEDYQRALVNDPAEAKLIENIMKLFTYLGLSVITLITVILSIETFYYSNDVNPILFIVITFIVLIYCLIKAIEEVKNNSDN